MNIKEGAFWRTLFHCCPNNSQNLPTHPSPVLNFLIYNFERVVDIPTPILLSYTQAFFLNAEAFRGKRADVFLKRRGLLPDKTYHLIAITSYVLLDKLIRLPAEVRKFSGVGYVWRFLFIIHQFLFEVQCINSSMLEVYVILGILCREMGCHLFLPIFYPNVMPKHVGQSVSPSRTHLPSLY